MAFRAAHPSFAGGEVSKSVAARWDVAKYNTALDKGRNMLGLSTGGQYNRPGFEFCDYTINPDRFSELFAFSFSVDQSYALEFGHEKMHVFWNGALVLEPQLLITAATQTNPLTVTVPNNGWAVGRRVYFSGINGMTELNGRELYVDSTTGDVLTFDVDATGWGAFLDSGGGVDGGAAGGTGGNPPPPAPGDPDPPVPSFPDRDFDPPRTGERPTEVLP